MTAAARFTIPRTFLARFARGGIHDSVVIAFRFSAAIGTNHRIRVRFHQFFKTFAATQTLIL